MIKRWDGELSYFVPSLLLLMPLEGRHEMGRERWAELTWLSTNRHPPGASIGLALVGIECS